jgi:uncharacterized protein (DUF305 family)
MSIDLETPAATTERDASRRSFPVVLVAVLVVAALAVAGSVGWLIGNTDSGPSVPSESSVDAGFARDMSTHHTQAVDMAGYTRDNTGDPSIKILARDIETQQYFQIGEMQGWLDNWGLSRTSTLAPMSWMAGHSHLESDRLMPGMATPAQMDKLETLTGKPLDIYFLQLMIHHHQGGLPMAQYAAEHATEPYVRNLAQKMAQAQSNEIVQMEQMLRQLGGTPLPAPS